MLNLGMSKASIAQALGIPMRTLYRLLNGRVRARYPLQCLMESLLPDEVVERIRQRYIEDMSSRRVSFWERLIERKGHGTGY